MDENLTKKVKHIKRRFDYYVHFIFINGFYYHKQYNKNNNGYKNKNTSFICLNIFFENQYKMLNYTLLLIYMDNFVDCYQNYELPSCYIHYDYRWI